MVYIKMWIPAILQCMSTRLESCTVRNLLVLYNTGYNIHSVMLVAGPGMQVSYETQLHYQLGRQHWLIAKC